nr:TRAP transporter small permease [uncultured Roseovarius sp.]
MTNRSWPGKSLVLIGRHFEEFLCLILIVGMLSAIFLQVVLRYIFESPVSWSDEIAIYCLIGTVYFGAALAVRERAHIRLMLFVNMLPRPLNLIAFLIGEAIWMGFNIIMMWKGWLMVQLMSQFAMVSPSLGINQKWPFSIVAIGFALMIFRMLQEYYSWYAKGEITLPESSND